MHVCAVSVFCFFIRSTSIDMLLLFSFVSPGLLNHKQNKDIDIIVNYLEISRAAVKLSKSCVEMVFFRVKTSLNTSKIFFYLNLFNRNQENE